MTKKLIKIIPVIMTVVLLAASCKKAEPTDLKTSDSNMVHSTTTFAGSGSRGNNDGLKERSSFATPYGLCLDEMGNLVIADTNNNAIRKADKSSVSKLAGKVTGYDEFFNAAVGFKDGKVQNALLGKPTFVTMLENNTIAFSDSNNNMIRVIDNESVYTIAGSTTAGYKDGNVQEALFNYPTGIACDPQGNLYVSDTKNHCIRKINSDNTVETYAGTPGISGYTDGSLASAQFNEPMGIAVDHTGAVYVCDSGNQRIRKIKNGKVTTIAGNASGTIENTNYMVGGYKDGKSSEAQFNFPTGIDVSDDLVIFVADKMNNRIRVITPNGDVKTVAGCNTAGLLNSVNETAQFNQPIDVVINTNVLYVSDSLNNVIREVEINMNDYLK